MCKNERIMRQEKNESIFEIENVYEWSELLFRLIQQKKTAKISV